MFARSTTITGDASALDAGIDYVRDEVMPMILRMDGCAGLSMLVDRDSGRCIVTSSWHTEDAMRASNEQLAQVRARAGEMLGGSPQIEEWEVAMMHRDHMTHDGACCRVTWMRMGEGDLDRGIDRFRAEMLPDMQALDGFCSASLLVNRVTGQACATTTYDSREAMMAARERASQLRESRAREAGVEITEVAEFDLALAHLRVPEMA